MTIVTLVSGCGEWRLFDATTTMTPGIDQARTEALALCASCPALTRCAAYVDSLRSHQRPRGVGPAASSPPAAQHDSSEKRPRCPMPHHESAPDAGSSPLPASAAVAGHPGKAHPGAAPSARHPSRLLPTRNAASDGPGGEGVTISSDQDQATAAVAAQFFAQISDQER
jgi:hypothetical protein